MFRCPVSPTIYELFAVGLMSKPCACCHGWNKKKHPCGHDYCEKPCKKQIVDQQIQMQKQQAHLAN